VARNHFEAITLLLQDELWSQRLERCIAWRRHRVCLGVGQDSGNGRCIRTYCGDRAAYENSQLSCDTTEKHLLVALHTSPSITGSPGWKELYIKNLTPLR
jgi:hypothetical protein